MDSIAKAWQRRRPEATVLYRVLAEHLETFLAVPTKKPPAARCRASSCASCATSSPADN
jgi:hypothetical protein